MERTSGKESVLFESVLVSPYLSPPLCIFLLSQPATCASIDRPCSEFTQQHNTRQAGTQEGRRAGRQAAPSTPCHARYDHTYRRNCGTQTDIMDRTPFTSDVTATMSVGYSVLCSSSSSP
mmetsp:Transcript_1781/g.3880  ORF Transcript_1781/g.3880 Transcript_1781/m.3880 type:complete len:120 (-) Transcript_1781:75-434(-)